MYKYALFNHHGKADAYLRALPASRYERVNEESTGEVDFVLTDHAILSRIKDLYRFWDYYTERFFVYPHAARPNVVNDIVEEWDKITAHFVAAPGHVWVMRAYGYEKPIHVAGWHLCPVRKFQTHKRPRRVLFAPIHYRCAEIDQDVNREAFTRLARLAESNDIQLTVRHIGELGPCGIEPVWHPNITYTQGELRPCWEQIDRADVVVSHQTFAWIAVARGIPTVMMAEDMPAHLVTEPPQFARNWNKYQDVMAFPLDILSCEDTLGLLGRAVKKNDAVEAWKARMIGEAFSPGRFREVLEKYL